MSEVSADELRKAVEAMPGCHASLREVVPVRETFKGQSVWEGVVHVFSFDLKDYDTCYAWSMAAHGDRRRVMTVLGMPPIESARMAVMASIVADK